MRISFRGPIQPTKAPLGYLNVRETVGGRQVARIIPDPERAPHIKTAFDLYASGDWTIERLHAEMVKQGFRSRPRNGVTKPIGFTTLAGLLSGKVYAGIVEWQGVESIGQHEPLVSSETFETVQRILKSRSARSVRERKHNHYLKGVLLCGACGRKLSCDLKKQRYLYFYCLG